MWFAGLLGGLIQIAGTLVGQVLISLGIGYVTYSGIDVLLNWVRAEFLAGLSGGPAAAVQLAGVMGVGVCASMLLSAFAARLTLMGMSSGTIKRFAMK